MVWMLLSPFNIWLGWEADNIASQHWARRWSQLLLVLKPMSFPSHSASSEAPNSSWSIKYVSHHGPIVPVPSLTLSSFYFILWLCLYKKASGMEWEDHGSGKRPGALTLQLWFIQVLWTWPGSDPSETHVQHGNTTAWNWLAGRLKYLVDNACVTNINSLPFTVTLSAPDCIQSSCFDLPSPFLQNSIPFT